MALMFFSFTLRWATTLCCWYTIVVIHESCVPLSFGRMFLPIFRIEIWLTLQIPYNIFQKCWGNSVTPQGKIMPNTAICYSFFTNLALYLSAHCTSWEFTTKEEPLLTGDLNFGVYAKCKGTYLLPYWEGSLCKSHGRQRKTEKWLVYWKRLGVIFYYYQSHSLWSWCL